MTEAELVRNYAEVRNRLYGTPQRQFMPVVRALPAPDGYDDPEPPLPAVRENLRSRRIRDFIRIDHKEISIPFGIRLEEPLPDGAPTWRRIIYEVCVKHSIPIADIMSNRRPKPIVAARHEAIYRMRMETTLSYPQIGRKMGGRDHSSCVNAVRIHTAKMAREALKNIG